MNKKIKYSIITIITVAVMVFGYWTISPFFIKVVVKEDFPIDMVANMQAGTEATSTNTVLGSDNGTTMNPTDFLERQGRFVGYDKIHNGTGTASIYALKNDQGETRRFLRFEEGFKVNNGPDLFVGFGKDGTYVKGSEISKLKGTDGSQNYEIPSSVDLSQYDSVFVWCKAFSTPFIRADLSDIMY
jgi:hypothetical protein